MRILVDYRPALRARTGVGEYVHEMVRALLGHVPPGGAESLTLFSSSWRDRPQPEAAQELRGAAFVDRRVPVRVLTQLWNRLEWPAIEALAGPHEVVHAATPLLIPARTAAQVVTIHDLHFLRHPDRMTAEMRRDFPRLVRDHASRAHAIVVSSRFGERDVRETLGIPADRIYLCPPGVPAWATDVAAIRAGRPRRHILCFGTLEPRKNVGVLLDAYNALRARHPDAPPLVLAGGVTPFARDWVERTRRLPLAGHVEVTGYVSDRRRRTLFADAHMLVMPSLDEGFGLPVLEAMASGVPVVISTGGSLPEVAGPAATPVDPRDAGGFASAMADLLDTGLADAAAARGRDRAVAFSWMTTAESVRRAYRGALSRR